MNRIDLGDTLERFWWPLEDPCKALVHRFDATSGIQRDRKFFEQTRQPPRHQQKMATVERPKRDRRAPVNFDPTPTPSTKAKTPRKRKGDEEPGPAPIKKAKKVKQEVLITEDPPYRRRMLFVLSLEILANKRNRLYIDILKNQHLSLSQNQHLRLLLLLPRKRPLPARRKRPLTPGKASRAGPARAR